MRNYVYVNNYSMYILYVVAYIVFMHGVYELCELYFPCQSLWPPLLSDIIYSIAV